MDFLSRWRIQIGLALAVVPAMFLFVSTSAQQPPSAQQPAAPAAGARAGQPTTTANMTGQGGFVDSADLDGEAHQVRGGRAHLLAHP